MVDNFSLIEKILTFESEDEFYHLQILRRGKDHPELPSANRVIKAYYITSIEHLELLKNEIISQCRLFESRAYINLNPKSIKRTTLLEVSYLAQRVYNGDFKKPWKSWNHCASSVKGNIPRWLVDIDEQKDLDNIMQIQKDINDLQPEVSNKIIATIPTKTGKHLITSPFNICEFSKKYNLTVYKNNPTILYVP